MLPKAALFQGSEGHREGKADPAIDGQRARIRAQSTTVADHIAADPEAKAFMDDWATPEPISP